MQKLAQNKNTAVNQVQPTLLARPRECFHVVESSTLPIIQP
jgi:hypothetical protein